jgi:tetratricopeptide (TPR) repeat protein/peroxiredoxin
MRKATSILVASAAIAIGATTAGELRAQQPGAPAHGGAAERLRALYFQQDFEGGFRLGLELLEHAGDDVEARAWHAIHMARHSLAREAVAEADALVERWPENAWSYIAQSVAVSYDGRTKDAPEIAAHARELEPANPYAIWALGLALHRAAEYDQVVATIDAVFPEPHDWSELLVLKANALLVQGGGSEPDSARLELAHELFEQARARDPQNSNAHFFPGVNLINRNRIDEGLALIDAALELAPYSIGIHTQRWRALNMRRDIPTDEKRALIIESAERLVAARPDYPGTLRSVASYYRTIEAGERAVALEERVLTDFGETIDAEWVLTNRYRALADSIFQNRTADSVAARARFVQMLWDYVDRPVHHSESLLGSAYLMLLGRVSDDETVSNEDLLRVAQGVAQYDRLNPHTTHSSGPIALAERGVHFREAEAIVMEGFDRIGAYVERMEGVLRDIGELAQMEDRLKATQHDALGWIYFHEGRLEDAERELMQAYELNRENASVLYHLGRLAQAKDDLEQAEIYYARGYGQEVRWGPKRSTQALETLYAERHGSLDGWDDYLGELAERDRQQRRAKIAASRIAEPEPAPAFELEWLHGGSFSSDELDGRIAVINFWGVWCGPCVREAPQIQQFHEKFKDDADVVFLTIDYGDSDLDMVRNWMAEKEYDFPVLVDDGFVRSASVNAFPTTWFLDRDGRIAFRHIGASDVVFEEFVWRVEMLREHATIMEEETARREP